MQMFALLLTMQMLITLYNVYSIGYQATMLIYVFFSLFLAADSLKALFVALSNMLGYLNMFGCQTMFMLMSSAVRYISCLRSVGRYASYGARGVN